MFTRWRKALRMSRRLRSLREDAVKRLRQSADLTKKIFVTALYWKYRKSDSKRTRADDAVIFASKVPTPERLGVFENFPSLPNTIVPLHPCAKFRTNSTLRFQSSSEIRQKTIHQLLRHRNCVHYLFLGAAFRPWIMFLFVSFCVLSCYSSF